MSVAVARPLRPGPATAPARAPLRAVEPRRKSRPNLLRASIVLVCLGGIFGAQLLLSIVVSSGAYEIAALESQQKDLNRTADNLQEQLQRLGSTQNLAQQAAGLGMVQGANASFLRLSDSAVILGANPTPRYGCVATCGLVANELLVGIQPVTPVATAGASGAAATTASTTAGTSASDGGTALQALQQPATDTIPAPVTR